jgi:hypothetical protein
MHPKPLVGNIHGANRRNVGVIGLLHCPEVEPTASIICLAVHTSLSKPLAADAAIDSQRQDRGALEAKKRRYAEKSTAI